MSSSDAEIEQATFPLRVGTSFLSARSSLLMTLFIFTRSPDIIILLAFLIESASSFIYSFSSFLRSYKPCWASVRSEIWASASLSETISCAYRSFPSLFPPISISSTGCSRGREPLNLLRSSKYIICTVGATCRWLWGNLTWIVLIEWTVEAWRTTGTIPKRPSSWSGLPGWHMLSPVSLSLT